MSRKVRIKWKCSTCDTEIISKVTAFNIIYADSPHTAFCPICGTASLMKIEEIFEVEMNEN